MNLNSTIIVTGAAGFIGSCMVQYLNENGYRNLILADDFEAPAKYANWEGKAYLHAINYNDLLVLLTQDAGVASCVIHLGACSDTTEFDYSVHERLNLAYSKAVWQYCAQYNVPLIYASSASTYGNGEHGYSDNHQEIEKLEPLNPYGVSKNLFDKWALTQTSAPAAWTGLKFFNVYGPNEYHKERMASVIWHAFNQINNTGQVKLFKSYRPEFKDGEQLRDFVYVKDLLKVMFWMMTEMVNGQWDIAKNGLYNIGTGKARSFFALASATFKSLDKEPNIVFIDMPEDIRGKYQYFTEADMDKLHEAGYSTPFYTLEDGVDDYVRNYLTKQMYY